MDRRGVKWYHIINQPRAWRAAGKPDVEALNDMDNICVQVDATRVNGTINPNIFGHFSEHLGRCIYGGFFVGESSPIANVKGMRRDVVEAMRRIRVPVLRWPGGCFADEYHWRDGIGPQAARKRMVNTHWGYVVEDNSFGTHEFMELCRQIGCAPYVNGNLGSGSVKEMSEWVEYLNSDGDSSVVRERRANGQDKPFGVKYFGVGNESWGCGGNMRPEYYADEYRRYQTFCRNYGENRLYRIACGPNTDDYRWTEVLMQRAARYMDALTLHYYTVPSGEWARKGSATRFDQARYYETLRRALYMDTIIRGHLAVMDRYDPERRVSLIVDEWGCWHDVEAGTNPGFLYQQNTMRDAIVAALTLNVFMAHCDRVSMANLAQTVNVLQSLVLTEGDKMALTPTYHVFDLYKAHQGAQALACCVAGAADVAEGVRQVYASASMQGQALTLTLTNTSAGQSAPVCVRVQGFTPRTLSGRVLCGAMDAYNDFDRMDAVSLKPFEGAALDGQGGICAQLPPCSVTELTCL